MLLWSATTDSGEPGRAWNGFSKAFVSRAGSPSLTCQDAELILSLQPDTPVTHPLYTTALASICLIKIKWVLLESAILTRDKRQQGYIIWISCRNYRISRNSAIGPPRVQIRQARLLRMQVSLIGQSLPGLLISTHNVFRLRAASVFSFSRHLLTLMANRVSHRTSGHSYCTAYLQPPTLLHSLHFRQLDQDGFLFASSTAFPPICHFSALLITKWRTNVALGVFTGDPSHHLSSQR